MTGVQTCALPIYQRKVEQFRTSQGELQRLQNEENQKVQQNYQVALGEEAKKLSAAMPVFQDEEKAEEIRGNLRTFLKSKDRKSVV